MLDEELSTADLGDRHRTLSAVAALALSIFFGASAAERVAAPDLAALLDWAALSMAALAVLLVVPILAWKLRRRGGEGWHLYRGRDGFVADVLARAHIVSWTVTFFVLVLLRSLAGRFEGLPPGFFFEAVLAIMLAVFSVSFLVLDRSASEDDPEDDPEA